MADGKRNRKIAFVQPVCLTRTAHENLRCEALAYQFRAFENPITEEIACQYHDDIGPHGRFGADQVLSGCW